MDEGLTTVSAEPDEAFTHYKYQRSGEVWATASIDTDIHVWLI